MTKQEIQIKKSKLESELSDLTYKIKYAEQTAKDKESAMRAELITKLTGVIPDASLQKFKVGDVALFEKARTYVQTKLDEITSTITKKDT